ncbi:HotDog domain-containing protein [Mycotypha africana]|uniref:HotDog domain-containing protein n=1 Tax=Mycotypha africana TaxID=64632 RepID=UPI0023008760|nr:HotDog domain-containing protein [Mycotypha africana]KAI8982246.1 HotDog domain-containing protein [Mycotypha africana]
MTVLDTTFEPIPPSHNNNNNVKVIAKEDSNHASSLLADEEASLDLVQSLRESDDWEEIVAYDHLSESAKSHSLTATSLRQPHLIERRPLKFYNKDKTKCVMIAHLGPNLCGHDGIIHGGLAATLLDEMLAYVTIPHLPTRTGFTANLNVNYRKPIVSNQWVVIRGEFERTEGRKAWGKAWIETTDASPVLLTEATALYMGPRSN